VSLYIPEGKLYQKIPTDLVIWLQRTGKLNRIINNLDDWHEHLVHKASYQDINVVERLADLQKRLATCKDHPDERLGLDVLYQPSKKEGELAYPYFISVSVPLRMEGTGLPARQEIGTLNVDVRLGKDQKKEEIFTLERIHMLQTISEVLYTIL